MSKKEENPLKLLAIVLAAGVGFYVAIILISMLIGWILAVIFKLDWIACSIVVFFIIKFFETLESGEGSKCTECKRKILTRNPIKCEVCGGPARLTDREYKKVLKKQIYKRKETT